MKICVYGAASNVIDKKYIDAGYELGQEMAKAGCELVFGGGANGLMGAAAEVLRHKAARLSVSFRNYSGTEALKYYSINVTAGYIPLIWHQGRA